MEGRVITLKLGRSAEQRHRKGYLGQAQRCISSSVGLEHRALGSILGELRIIWGQFKEDYTKVLFCILLSRHYGFKVFRSETVWSRVLKRFLCQLGK